MSHFKLDMLKIKHSKRKSIGLYVTGQGVEVRAPIGTSKAYIQQFVLSKSTWIEKQLESVQNKTNEVYQLRNGQALPILGELKTVEISLAPRSGVIEHQEKLCIHVTRMDQKRIEKVFADYLLSKAKQIIPDLVSETSAQLELSHRVKDIKFRRTKTKWGHCTHEGRLQFNWLIMMAPMKIVRSLVCHEVCHLKYLNHSEAFWKLVRTIDPDYLLSKHWLKVHGHKLSLFE
ncbi:M48 family metallopeptidase [Litoribrevibacter albus]|uniref:YgjP-like metallopeptidase domain-containing protein n=1 Tax=Litoribrevibacter albus TaxID=1473156 RepID=A0AA37SC01_9GAMM|nr:SprT family zinc-dependent metalloprotease [Litoribrevibacter albus]GLQ31776.1 hypothetical protein GCM10007876_22550 [Litoribrevibacter albus]